MLFRSSLRFFQQLPAGLGGGENLRPDPSCGGGAHRPLDLEVGPDALQAQLAALPPAAIACVDAERPEQLNALGEAIWACTRQGQRFALQSAASLINGLVPLPPQPLDVSGLAGLRRREPGGDWLPGLVLVGSHEIGRAHV